MKNAKAKVALVTLALLASCGDEPQVDSYETYQRLCLQSVYRERSPDICGCIDEVSGADNFYACLDGTDDGIEEIYGEGSGTLGLDGSASGSVDQSIAGDGEAGLGMSSGGTAGINRGIYGDGLGVLEPPYFDNEEPIILANPGDPIVWTAPLVRVDGAEIVGPITYHLKICPLSGYCYHITGIEQETYPLPLTPGAYKLRVSAKDADTGLSSNYSEELMVLVE